MNKVEDIPGEQWHAVSYDSRYCVSNFGRIKFECYTKNGRFISRLRKQHIGKKWGYMSVGIGRKGTYLVHRLVCSAFLPEPPEKLGVNHKNGIKTDNRIENLEWATDHENRIHLVSVLKHRYDDWVLNPEDVTFIRMALARGVMAGALVKHFNVAWGSITSIRDGFTYTHIPHPSKEEISNFDPSKYGWTEWRTRGSELARSKLTEEIVRDARKAYFGKTKRLIDMCRSYGVNNKTLLSAIHGKTWKHVV